MRYSHHIMLLLVVFFLSSCDSISPPVDRSVATTIPATAVMPSATMVITTFPDTPSSRLRAIIINDGCVDAVTASNLIQTTDTLWDLYVELVVYEGCSTTALADAVLMVASEVAQTASYGYAGIIMSDGVQAVSYVFDFDADVWDTSVMTGVEPPTPSGVRTGGDDATAVPVVVVVPAEVTAIPPTVESTEMIQSTGQVVYVRVLANLRTCPRVADECGVTRQAGSGEALAVVRLVDGETVRESTRWYAVNDGGREVFVHESVVTVEAAPTGVTAVPAVVVPNQGAPANVTAVPALVVTPSNCATAVAAGLSDVEAAQHAHLDRDQDGVACYGD